MKNSTKYLLALSAIVGTVGTVSAIPTLTLSDNLGDSVTIVDGGSNDANSSAGAVTFIGALGVWNLNVTTGLSSNDPATLDLNSVDNATAAGVLTLTFSDTGFTTLGNAATSIGGTTGLTNTVDFSTWSGATSLTTGSFGGTSFSGDAASNAQLWGTYGLTEVVTITSTGKGTTSFDAALSVPDSGMTALLLGLGILVIAGVARRFKMVTQ
jgi:VPDSG-CTERM motif